MRNRWLEAKLRRLEKSIESLEKPTVCGATINGDLRTLSPVAKTRELEALVQKLAECQSLVQTDSEQEWVSGAGNLLKEKVMAVFNPPMLKT